jgi:hypothetical protein
VICGSCGHENAPGQKFCGECGTRFGDEAPLSAPAGSSTPVLPVPAAERRLVSVLFADLVGFTTLTELAEWLAGADRADEAQRGLDEAREIFERLQVRPWLERLAKLHTPAPAA